MTATTSSTRTSATRTREADAIVRSLAHHLRDVHGVGSGDRVAIAMRNYPEWVFSYWAIVSIGAACVGMNAWWTTDEMKYGLADSAPKVVIADSERVERILPMLDELRTTNPLHVITVRYDGDLPADASRWDDVVASRSRHRPACRTPRSTPTTTPASSTPRARRASRRGPS